MRGVHNEYQRPTKKEKRAAAGKATVCGALSIELTEAVAFKRRGVETKLVLPGLAQPSHSARCDPALIKAIARGRAWFEELATGRARSRRWPSVTASPGAMFGVWLASPSYARG